MRDPAIRIGRLTIYPSKVARGNNGDNPSWNGYCYGSYWPRIKIGKASAWYCLDALWLVYFVSIYWNRKP